MKFLHIPHLIFPNIPQEVFKRNLDPTAGCVSVDPECDCLETRRLLNIHHISYIDKNYIFIARDKEDDDQETKNVLPFTFITLHDGSILVANVPYDSLVESIQLLHSVEDMNGDE